MKKNLTLLTILLITMISSGLQQLKAQANTQLSNLVSPTAINHSLLPNNNKGFDLGSAAKSWRVMYVDSAIYLKDAIFMHAAGSNNAFAGFQAGKAITTGVQNAAFGYNALPVNTTGSQNTALGKAVLYQNVSGSFNSGSGYQALFSNTSGVYNTASGAYSLYFNINGSFNTATGGNALRGNQNGPYNAAFGYNAGYNTLGSRNVFVGSYAGYDNVNGSNNVYLGYNAGGSASVSNSVAIGANVNAIQSNTIILGTGQKVGIGTNNPSAQLYVLTQTETTATYSASNAASGFGVYGQANATNSTGVRGEANNGTLAYGVWGKSSSGNGVVGEGNHYGVWGVSSAPGFAGYFTGNVNVTGSLTWASDQKLKENIKPVDRILDKVMLLKPSLYSFKKEYDNMNLAKGEQVGFIAQELEKVFPQLVKTIIDQQPNRGKQTEYKAVNYVALIPLLTKAIQEQQQEINDLKQEVNKLSGASTNEQTTNLSNAALNQNIPNPFSDNTNIQYTVPSNFKKAQLVITDANGAVVKQVALRTAGKGSVNVNASNLSSGTYTYSLIVDGNTIESKKMVLGK